MGFKIDLVICGESVECEALIGKDEYGYKGFYVEDLNMGDSCIIELACLDHVNEFIIDDYLESVGE